MPTKQRADNCFMREMSKPLRGVSGDGAEATRGLPEIHGPG